MNENKMRRIITACVSACTVLFLLLLSFLCYQWITKAQLEKKEKKLLQEIAYYEELLSNKSDVLDYYESEYYLQKAYQELAALRGENKK